MREDAQTFCDSCLHCLATDSRERIPRPLGHSLRASKPNEVIHFDFCWLPKSSCGMQYLFVLKDGLSSYIRISACESADADTAADRLLDWFSTFSVVKTWVSDQGLHFKNSLISTLKERLRCSHHFTLPYCPWSNGTVEVVCRELTRCLRALLSEYSLPYGLWPRILPLVQAALNSLPLKRLGGRSPSQVFANLDPSSALSEIKVHRAGNYELVSISEANARQEGHLQAMQEALENMHRDVSCKADAARQKRVASLNKRTGVRPCNFEGDYVLHTLLRARKMNKLSAQWVGPFRVRKFLSDFLFELEDLRDGEVKMVHGTRIKLFRNADFNRDIHLDEYLSF